MLLPVSMTKEERAAWCEFYLPELWPEAKRIRDFALSVGMRCFPSISGNPEYDDPPELCLTFYWNDKILGCAGRTMADETWSWYLKGAPNRGMGEADEAAFIAAIRAAAARMGEQ